jgi:hypothetical protein
MVVDVAVHCERASIAKGLEKTFNLPSQLQPNLGPDAGGASAHLSRCPHGSETAMEASMSINDQVHV